MRKKSAALKQQEKMISGRMLVLFVFGTIFLNYPILSLFTSRDITILGIPLLYAVVFLVWAILIGLTILIVGVNRSNEQTKTKAGQPTVEE